jgi:hypothetical protein
MFLTSICNGAKNPLFDGYHRIRGAKELCGAVGFTSGVPVEFLPGVDICGEAYKNYPLKSKAPVECTLPYRK